jgi:hypothetical protein
MKRCGGENPPGLRWKVWLDEQAPFLGPPRRWLAVAASVALMVGGAVLIQEQRQAESEKAKEKQRNLIASDTGSKVRNTGSPRSIQKRLVYPQLNP